MKHLNMIFSGEYVTPTLQAEFGKIIPSMLPVGNKNLIDHQITTLLSGKNLLSIPNDFNSTELSELNCRKDINFLEPSTPKQSLIQSILEYLNKYNSLGFQTYSIILGDTVIEDYEWKLNTFSSHISGTNYKWTNLRRDSLNVFSGYVFLNSAKLNEINKAIVLLRNGNINIENFLAFLDSNESGKWYDFGHYHNYHSSKKDFLSKRYFNSFESKPYSLVKRSTNLDKIQAEARWFSSIPKEISYHCPRLYSQSSDSYEIEHLYANSLSELLVHGKLPNQIWNQIYDLLLSLLDTFYSTQVELRPQNTLREFVTQKTLNRLSEFSLIGFDSHEEYTIDGGFRLSLDEMLDFVKSTWFGNEHGLYRVSHGDLCFSNILFDARSQKLSIIDPRGLDDTDSVSPYGYFEYDVAKLAHSIVYGYDHVIAGKIKTYFSKGKLTSTYKSYSMNADANFWNNINKRYNVSKFTTQLICLNLFLSMLPLHSDKLDNQLSFIYIASKIYKEIKEDI